MLPIAERSNRRMIVFHGPVYGMHSRPAPSSKFKRAYSSDPPADCPSKLLLDMG